MVIYTSMTKGDTFYALEKEDGNRDLYPIDSLIFIDDESGFISIKATATRKVIGLLRK